MSEKSFLNGKVVKRVLPLIRPGSGPDAPSLKRLILPQGELAQFYDGDPPMRYIALIELRENTVRGNHYHKIKEEWIYLIEGELQLLVEDVQSKTRETMPFEAGSLFTIQPGVAHVLQVAEPGCAIEFSPARFDPADTYRFVL